MPASILCYRSVLVVAVATVVRYMPPCNDRKEGRGVIVYMNQGEALACYKLSLQTAREKAAHTMKRRINNNITRLWYRCNFCATFYKNKINYKQS